MKIRINSVIDANGQRIGEISYWMWCPGCDSAVRITNEWDFDGNMEAPTFSPSIMVNQGTSNPTAPMCHSFLKNGMWEFLGDCSHALAGQTVPMVELPDWLANEEK